jgi:diadenosine tetraphosphate (Ap4A) HIT family hydrolase
MKLKSLKMQTDIEKALDEKRAPWSNLEHKTTDYWVFRDAYAVTEGHLLFVPTQESTSNVLKCYQAAYQAGEEGVIAGKWDGFNIGQNVGTAAGQTVMYPHIHMIPRRDGDMEDPRGGVRHVIPEKGNYKK